MIADMAKALLSLPDEIWCEYAFRRDTFGYKVKPDERFALGERARSEAEGMADELRSTHPLADMRQLASALQVTVELTDEGGGDLFACFREPKTIRIFSRVVEPARALLAGEAMPAVLRQFDLVEILLAHELFHAVEMRHGATVGKTTRITTFSLGPFVRSARLKCLSEIGAMAFCRRLAKLPWNPYLLDVIILYSLNKRRSKNLFDSIMKMGMPQGSA
ncbi:MAG: hypothetical protein LUC93_09565 [Planctomycetaceae bacterium]|nr:hypothetical protein [Planctomycetaceae bacterium]